MSDEGDAPVCTSRRGHKWRQLVWGVLGTDKCARRGCNAQRTNPDALPPDGWLE